MGRAGNNTAQLRSVSECGQGWHPELIRAAIRMRGVTLEQFSELHGMYRTAVQRALIGKYRKAEVAISKFLDVPLWELWPNRWRSDGTRIDERFGRGGAK